MSRWSHLLPSQSDDVRRVREFLDEPRLAGWGERLFALYGRERDSFILFASSVAEKRADPLVFASQICSVMGSRTVDTSCLADPGSGDVTLISLKQCGNGIVEPGEDCDPGANGSSTCCDPDSSSLRSPISSKLSLTLFALLFLSACKFRTGAVCDPSSSACCNAQCGFSAAGVVCRAATSGGCDVAETCPGTNSTCPPDQTVRYFLLYVSHAFLLTPLLNLSGLRR